METGNTPKRQTSAILSKCRGGGEEEILHHHDVTEHYKDKRDISPGQTRASAVEHKLYTGFSHEAVSVLDPTLTYHSRP